MIPGTLKNREKQGTDVFFEIQGLLTSVEKLGRRALRDVLSHAHSTRLATLKEKLQAIEELLDKMSEDPTEGST